jgi:uncharacterized membrane protein YqaE (UPF0057 family)
MPKINASQWTLFDKLMYGGLGYGAFCLPTDFFKVIIAILFPPLGEVVNIIEDTVSDTFPYITWDSIKVLCTYKTLNTIVYSFLLTALFYIPGLIYTLTNIVEKERKVSYSLSEGTLGGGPGSEYITTDEEVYSKAEQIALGINTSGDKINSGTSSAIDTIGSGFSSIGSL